MSNIMNPAMVSRPVPFWGTEGPPGPGKFFRGFLAVFIALSMTGEMAYDGDFSKVKTVPDAVTRSCVKIFRAHPFRMSFTADVSTVAAGMEGMSGNRAITLLRGRNFVLADATALYAGRMVYNDRMLLATRSASHLWPEILRSDSCEIGLFLSNNRVTGAFAKAVRRGSEIFRLPAPTGTFPAAAALGF